MKNEIVLQDGYAEIILTYRNGDEKGRAKISVEDIELVADKRWFYSAGNYVGAWIEGKKRVFLHRFLLGVTDEQVDHINGDASDNRRSNLRTATQSQNMMNRAAVRGDMVGVCAYGKKWSAEIKANNVKYYLGLYSTVAEAMAAREAGERILFGDYSRRIYRDYDC